MTSLPFTQVDAFATEAFKGNPAAVMPLDAWLPATAREHDVPAKLPYLLKLLAAGAPLSIQVHPSKEQAVEGFAREEEAGVARDAGSRNYKDDNHKPEVIVALDPAFAAAARQDPLWQATPALRANRLHVSPSLPFGWVDFPPSVNRLMGLWWLGTILYPARFPEDIRAVARDLSGQLYHVVPDDAALDRLLAGAP